MGKGDLGQLLELARDKSADGRRALAAAVADLFAASGHVVSDRERFLMTDILRQLIKEVEISLRRALAERLSEDPQAPRELVVVLAHDAIEVAFPILRRSEVLADEELIEIIRHRTFEHQLVIAMRNRVSGAVSQALVDTGDADVIHTLLQNPDAEIKATTMAYLVEQSRRVDTFQNPLLHRRELSPELAQRMYWWVSAALRQHIVGRFDIDPSRLDRAIEDSVAASAPRRGLDAAPADRLAKKLASGGGISPTLLIDTLGQGEIDLFRALFARMTGLPLTLVNRLIFEPGGESLAIACKAVAMTRPTFMAIFALTRGPGFAAGGNPVRIGSLFDCLNRKAAQRMLKAWRRNPAYQHAVVPIVALSRAGAWA